MKRGKMGENYIHLQVGAWSEDDEGGNGHGKEEYQQKQTVDHQSHLVGGQFSPSGFEKKKDKEKHYILTCFHSNSVCACFSLPRLLSSFLEKRQKKMR